MAGEPTASTITPAAEVDREALEQRALVRPLGAGEVGHLRFRGPDAASFLHRMTTSHVDGLEPEGSQLTCFPDKRGRLVACAVLHRPAVDEVRALGRFDAAALATWLDQFLFTEELEVDAAGANGVELVGPRALEIAGRVSLSFAALTPFSAAVDDGTAAFRWFDVATPAGAQVPRVALLAEGPSEELLARLVDGGAHRGDRGVVEAARIAAGAPEPTAEIGEKHNPLELALHDALHWSKGCYIGQEVISRIDNYGKQARHLVALLPDERRARLDVGARVVADGNEIGTVTSAAPLDLGNGPTAIALLRGELPTAGRVVVETGSSSVPATVLGRAAAQTPHD